MDPRITQLATLILDHSLQLKSGEHLVICASDMSQMDLLRECYRLALGRDALVHVDIHHISMYLQRADHGGLFKTFLHAASNDTLSRPAPMMRETIAWGQKFLLLNSVHNRSFLSDADPKKIAQWRRVTSEDFAPILKKDRCVTYLPTLGTAQNAHMSLEDFEAFYYDAVLVDYAKMGKQIRVVQDILDNGKRVHIRAKDTELTIGIEGRLAAGADTGRRNLPDGECFIAPQEDVTEGTISFELPQSKDGHEMTNVKLRFEKGQIVEASAENGAEHLHAALEDHPNNRRLGELGIGLNPRIDRYIRDTIFDEKILGTFHIALGSAYDYERGGGPNKGTIHWDLVKDMRHKGSELRVDETIILKDGVLQV